MNVWVFDRKPGTIDFPARPWTRDVRGQTIVAVFVMLAVSQAIVPAVAGAAPNSSGTSVPEYLELVRRAEERSREEDWDGAAKLWRQVVEANPYDARFCYSFGIALYNAGKYKEAIEPLMKSLELGMWSLSIHPAFDIARSYGRLGEAKPALDWLGRALESGFRSRSRIRNEEAFRFLAKDVRFQTLAAVTDTTGVSRTERFRRDLAFLDEEVRRMHVAPFRKVSETEFEADLRKLSDDLPGLSDNQYAVRMMKLLAQIGDGHTGCFPEGVLRWTKTLPLHFEVFPEGLYVIEADSTHANLVGARVIRVGGHPTDDVLAAILPIASRDNDYELLRTGRHLRYPQLLEGLGFISTPDRVELTVRGDRGREREVTVAAVLNDPEYNRIVGHPKWSSVHGALGDRLPLYLRNRLTTFWFEHLPKQRMVYVQCNTVADTPEESFASFSDRLFRFIAEGDVQTLVVDLRWNNGGNAMLLPPFLAGAIGSKVNRPGSLFVVVGRYTFSAAMSAAVRLEQETNAILVGEPTASSPNRSGESNIVLLPHGRIGVSISDLYWQDSWPIDRRISLTPFLLAPPTFASYRAGRDPALEAIHAYPRSD